MAQPSMPRPGMLSIGHLSLDIHVAPDGGRSEPEPGGAAAFTALTAHRLGLRRVVAAGMAGSDYPLGVLDGAQTAVIGIQGGSLTFEDRTVNGQREQRVVERPERLPGATLRQALGRWASPRLLLAGPLLDELPLVCREWFDCEFSCLIAQGWFREVGADGLVRHRAPDVAAIVGQWDVIVLSEQEATVAGGISEWRRVCRMLAVTRGERGALVFDGVSEVAIPAVVAPQVVDTTGAGDVWAAAFSIRYVETGSVAEAGQFAAAAAAVCVSRKGLRGVPKSREEVEALL